MERGRKPTQDLAPSQLGKLVHQAHPVFLGVAQHLSLHSPNTVHLVCRAWRDHMRCTLSNPEGAAEWLLHKVCKGGTREAVRKAAGCTWVLPPMADAHASGAAMVQHLMTRQQLPPEYVAKAAGSSNNKVLLAALLRDHCTSDKRRLNVCRTAAREAGRQGHVTMCRALATTLAPSIASKDRAKVVAQALQGAAEAADMKAWQQLRSCLETQFSMEDTTLDAEELQAMLEGATLSGSAAMCRLVMSFRDDQGLIPGGEGFDAGAALAIAVEGGHGAIVRLLLSADYCKDRTVVVECLTDAIVRGHKAMIGPFVDWFERGGHVSWEYWPEVLAGLQRDLDNAQEYTHKDEVVAKKVVPALVELFSQLDWDPEQLEQQLQDQASEGQAVICAALIKAGAKHRCLHDDLESALAAGDMDTVRNMVKSKALTSSDWEAAREALEVEGMWSDDEGMDY